MAFWQRRLGVWNVAIRAHWKGIIGITLDYSWDREWGGDVALCLGLGVGWIEVQVLTPSRLWGHRTAPQAPKSLSQRPYLMSTPPMTAQPSSYAQAVYAAIVVDGHFIIDPTEPDDRVIRALQELLNLGLLLPARAFLPKGKSASPQPMEVAVE